MIGQPMNTGSQVVRIRYSSTDGTSDRGRHAECGQSADQRRLDRADAAGGGAADASVPPTIVTTVTATKVAPAAESLDAAHSECRTESGCRTTPTR